MAKKPDVRITEKTVGITATVPSEIIFAAGFVPLDLNNVFITSENPSHYLELAERSGFPANICAWIKGIYGVVKEMGVKHVVGLVEGDCSNTLALLEVLSSEGVKTTRFGYPNNGDPVALSSEIERFRKQMGPTRASVAETKWAMDDARAPLHEIDRLTWQEGKVTGSENFAWLISSSDFQGDYVDYGKRAAKFLAEARLREPIKKRFRLGLAGIPPIVTDLHDVLESMDAHVVLNEVPRQFAMPYRTQTLVEQYAHFTYPYDVFCKIDDIKAMIDERRIDGVVNYVQSFCYRSIQARLIKETLKVPVLTLEFDRPGTVDGRSLTRLEAFMEMLEGRKSKP